MKMVTLNKIIICLLLISTPFTRPICFNDTYYGGYIFSHTAVSKNPNLYFVMFTATRQNKEKPLKDQDSSQIGFTNYDDDDNLKSHSVKDVDDLENAAGTNILRPLFVYRQQLAYRDRVKKRVTRRRGIRPTF